MDKLTADVVIVGGGGIGSSIAFFLTSLAPKLKVIVCERDPTYAYASTTLAAGGVRQMFSTPENVRMSQFGLAFIKAADEALAVDSDAPSMGLKHESYLRLLPEVSRTSVMEQVEMQRRLGAKPAVLEPGALKSTFPWMNVEDVGFAVMGGGGEGVFDPYALLQALRRKAISQGATFLAADVVGLERGRDGAVLAAQLRDGSQIACGRVVNAAGPRAAAVAEMAGLQLPVVAVKANTFVFKSQIAIPDYPVMLDHIQGVNIKSEGEQFLAGWGGDGAVAQTDDFEPDHGMFERHVWERLAHRSPVFETVKLTRAWVGHIELNTFDANPILGPMPEAHNFVQASGFSGHGVQHIPAAGRAVAELMVFGAYKTLDLSRFGYERIVENRPLPELV